jgi:signal transduction histidine kinase/ActR/RegA family two-component response regulator
MSLRPSALVTDPYRRLVILIIGFVVAALLVGRIVLTYLQHDLIGRAGESLAIAAVGMADKVDRIYFERYGDIHMLARTFGSQMDHPAYLTAYLHWMQKTYHVYRWLGVTDATGRIIAATDPAMVGRDQGMTSWFQAAKREGHVITEDLQPHAEIGRDLATSFAAPITDASGHFQGVVASFVGVPVLTEIIQHMDGALQVQLSVSSACEYIVVTRHGDVIVDSLLRQEGQANLKALPSAERVTSSGAPGYVEEYSSRRQASMVTGYARMSGFQEFHGFGWGVLVGVPREAVLTPVARLTRTVAMAGLMVLLPLLGLVLWMTYRLRVSEGHLRRAHAELEARVEARTRELRESERNLQTLNVTLEAQVNDRTAALLAKQQELRSLALELGRTEARERKRLATELHDNLAQTLAFCKIKASAALTERTDRLPAVLRDLYDHLAEALTYTRTLMIDLRPMLLGDEHDLAVAIAWVVQKMQRYGLAVTVQDDGNPKSLDEEILTITYQSIHELLWNVVKHAHTQEAVVSLRRSDDNLEAVVMDQGVGFDMSGGWPSSHDGAFGLLSIRERVEPLGGRLVLASAPGQGTSATLIVPLKAEPAGARASSTAQKAPSARLGAGEMERPTHAPPSKIRVLLVDDHQIMREGLRSIIEEQADLEVVAEASDGEMAIEAARRFQPDVVIMDVNMPRMNGLEATRRIKAEFPRITVIGLSMHGDRKMAVAMEQAGVSAYLSKGGSFDILCSTIRSSLRQTLKKNQQS